MQVTLAALAFAATVLATPTPQDGYSAVTPEHATPSGCSASHEGSFEITVTDVASTGYKRDLQKRAEALTLTLADGVLLDASKRTGYIASNYQLQFDAPPQSGALVTSGFSICANKTLALGGSAIFYQCLSGSFYNLYDRGWAKQCSPVYIYAMPDNTGSVSVLPDGQPQVPTGGYSVVTPSPSGYASQTGASSPVSSGYAPVYSAPSNYTWIPSSAPAASVPLVTKTVYQTSLYTITSCAAEVTNCPAHSTLTQTSLVPVYTTVCPATETPSNLAPGVSYPDASESAPLPSAPAQEDTTIPVTRTVYQTQLYTIASCAPEVTDCPARSTIVYTSVVPAYTTLVAPSAPIISSVIASIPVVTGPAVSELTDGQVQAPYTTNVAVPAPSAPVVAPAPSAPAPSAPAEVPAPSAPVIAPAPSAPVEAPAYSAPLVVTSAAPLPPPTVTGPPVVQITDGQIQVPAPSAAVSEQPTISYVQSFPAGEVAPSGTLTSYTPIGTGSPNATVSTGLPQFTGAAAARAANVCGFMLAGVVGLFAVL